MVSEKQTGTVRWIEGLATVIEKTTMVPCVILGGAMVAVVMSGVFARYVLSSPMPWTEEVARFSKFDIHTGYTRQRPQQPTAAHVLACTCRE